MSKIRRVDFYPDEWLAGTRDLTIEERGSYWDVCSLIYSRGGPILDDEAWIARALGCDVRRWRRLRGRLVDAGKLLEVIADGRAYLTNGRSQREIERASDRIETAHRAAHASALARQDRGNFGPTLPRSTAEVGAKSARSLDENQGDLLNFNGLGRADATPPSSSQPSTTNQQYDSTLEGESLSSAAPPPQAAAPSPQPTPDTAPKLDTASVIFGHGLTWLMERTSRPRGHCAGMLGRWRKEHGDAALIEALGVAQREGALEPFGFITRTLKERSNGTQAPRAGYSKPTTSRPSAIRTAANFAAALGGFDPGGSDRDRWEPDTDGMETAEPYDPAGAPRRGR